MYDVIIIGSGPAGISASLYTVRANLKTLIFYQEKSNLNKTDKIENYYGFEHGIDGKELYNQGIKQAQNLGVELKEEEVINIKLNEKEYEIITNKGNYQTKTVILATGSKKAKPEIKGIDEFEGKGISYCAVCDGFFYKNKNVAVIGNGNYAISEANELTHLANSITILTNGKDMLEVKGDKDNNIKIDTREIEQIIGETKVEEIKFKDGTSLKIDGIFIAEGIAGSIDFAKKLGIISKSDKIIVNENMETNVKGIYACGDCTGGLLQISKAVYEGAKAGLQVVNYVRQIN